MTGRKCFPKYDRLSSGDRILNDILKYIFIFPEILQQRKKNHILFEKRLSQNIQCSYLVKQPVGPRFPGRVRPCSAQEHGQEGVACATSLPTLSSQTTHLQSGSEKQRRLSSRQLGATGGSAQLGAMVLRRRSPQPRSLGAHGHSSRPCA